MVIDVDNEENVVVRNGRQYPELALCRSVSRYKLLPHWEGESARSLRLPPPTYLEDRRILWIFI